jgi:hypothetical protein
MASQRPGKGQPFPPGKYTFGGHTIDLGADGGIRVRAGDTVSRYSGCLYKDVLMGWEEFGEKSGEAVRKLPNVNLIRVGQTVYHMPTWEAQKKQPAPTTPDRTGLSSLTFNGRTLDWKSSAGVVWLSVPAVSGLRKNNPLIKKLIKAGRTELQEGVDYTDKKYQDLPMVGPIPEGEYQLALTPDMPFDKTRSGGGWGVGAWPLNPTSRTDKILHWLDVRYDLPGVRSGFFLHHDGVRAADGQSDGTAGCIGVIDSKDLLDLQAKLSEYQAKEKRSTLTVRVKY